MIDLQSREPQYQDEVKHKKNDATGIVIAKFMLNGKWHIDVRSFAGRIHYNSPVENWTVVNTEEMRP